MMTPGQCWRVRILELYNGTLLESGAISQQEFRQMDRLIHAPGAPRRVQSKKPD